jgi:hypothetical protein
MSYHPARRSLILVVRRHLKSPIMQRKKLHWYGGLSTKLLVFVGYLIFAPAIVAIAVRGIMHTSFSMFLIDFSILALVCIGVSSIICAATWFDFRKEVNDSAPAALPPLSPLLRTLDDLSYVIECAAIDYLGEGKTELRKLCENLENNPEYDFADKLEIASVLREALDYYRGDEKIKGSMNLGAASRTLWRMASGS